MRDYTRLDAFLDRLQGDLYPDQYGQQHEEITNAVIDALVEAKIVRPTLTVLDIGAGIGLATNRFQKEGLWCYALDSAYPEEGLLGKGPADQNFLRELEPVDLVWARHVLEHSPMPYFTLTEYARVLKPGGYCYVEVPAPNTHGGHETNPNHYSVMGHVMWMQLMTRAGFTHERQWKFEFQIDQLDDSKINDIYLGFLLKKP